MNNYKRTETFDAIANELCRRVGLAFPPPEGTKYEVGDAQWTEAEENDFRGWLTGYLKTVPGWKQRSKREIKREVDWFIFQYGWKYSDTLPDTGRKVGGFGYDGI
jgi:hypothetical protein